MPDTELRLIHITDLFPTILLTMVAALVLSPLATRLARRFGLLDVPGSSVHKIHDRITPMGGGMVIAGCLALSSLWFGWISSVQALGISLGAMAVFAVGLWDDAQGLGAPQKLIGQILGAGILIGSGTQVRLLANDAINLLLTVIWVVGVVNAFNFVDSMDGLALGIGGVAAAFFMLVSVESEQPHLSGLAAALLGTCIGLHFFNVLPARLFLGDSGSQQLGFVLAAIGVAYNPVGLERLSSWFVPILVLAIPIFDATLVVVSRLRGRRPLYRAGRDHTYHRLVKLGLEPSRAVVLMQTAASAAGIAAFLALNSGGIVGNLIFATVMLLGGCMIVIFERFVVAD